jgi:hypothetical protein
MKKETISAVVPANEAKGVKEMSASVIVNFAENLNEAKAMFGEEAILTNAFANWRVTIQSNIRSGLKRGESPEAIATRLSTAKMGVAATGSKVDPEQAYLALFAAATPEKQKEMLAELKAKAATK